MTVTTHTRVERGYFRRYYKQTGAIRRSEARENFRCRYRRGWARWLIVELCAYWSAEATGASPQILESILFSLPTSDQWMRYACDGPNKRSIGKKGRQTLSIG